VTRGRTCWVMTQDAAGMVSQALGLAEALGFDNPVLKKVALRWPWTWAPNWRALASLSALGPGSDEVAAPWPDLLVTCGRKAAMVSMAIGKLAPAVRRVHIQNPRAGWRHYDLLVVPRHDRLTGGNVVLTNGAVHRVNARQLEAGRKAFADRLAGLRRPLVAVLLGGSNHSYRLDAAWAQGFVAQLLAMQEKSGCGLAITPSRRTDPEAVAVLRKLLPPETLIWDGSGENPYFGFLGSADVLIVTCDSISMVSEACATGKPVLLAALPGKSERFDGFFGELEKRRLVRWFDGQYLTWDNGRLDDMDGIARNVATRLGWT
jgi:mitochondrial fission protein ELM1